MLTLEEAIILAVEAHYGQKDLYGGAFILHPLTVMSKMSTDVERIVAVLHDVTEDTELTLDDIIAIEATDDIIKSLVLLDKNNHESYADMIKGIKEDDIARKVKIADLEHNMDIKRIIGRECLSEGDKNRLGKYLWAWSYLTDN